MSHKSLLVDLLPPVSYDTGGSNILSELVAEGNLLDGAQLKAKSVVNAITPYRADQLIVDWERVLDLYVDASDSYQQRLEAVLQKLAETGGLSRPYFINLAARLGYSIVINELEPFYVDYGCVDRDQILPQDAVFIWQVVIFGGDHHRLYSFRCDLSCVGESLLSFGDPVIEAVFNDLKPAHTFVYFAYQ